MVKIRLRRMGTRGKPFYRVVVSSSRNVPTGRVVESLGYYDPRRRPSILELDVDRVDYWVSRGAQATPTVNMLIRRARREAV